MNYEDSPRAIRLWYQSFAPFPHFGGYSEVLRDTLARSRDPETSVRVEGIEQPSGITDLEFRSVEFNGAREVLGNASRAQAAGYDAFLIGNIADPALFEVRELLEIPVLGLCETALHVAGLMGRSIGLVTVNDRFTLRVLENVKRYGLEGHVAAHERIHVASLPALADAFRDQEKGDALEAAFADAAQRCVARGAEVIIAASGIVMIFLTSRGIHEVAGAPVLDGAVTLLKLGEMAVKLRRLTGHFTSKAGSYAGPPDGVAIALRALYSS